MTRPRLIIVANRLPFRISVRKGQLSFSQSAGGLVSSLESYLRNLNKKNNIDADELPTWIGLSDMQEAKLKEYSNSGSLQHERLVLEPVFLPPIVKDGYYNGFCNDTIWPLFHYFPSYARFRDEHYEHYKTANNLFAQKVAEIYRPGDLVWVHDYHLMLLPGMLRNHIPDATIGFFLHIPFPSFELFRLLPNQWRKEILNGLLGADLVGFHTNDYVQYFLKSVQQLLGYDNKMRVVMTPERSIMTDVFPVSIDFDKFHCAADNAGVYAEYNAIRKKLDGIKIIISVDRLDYTKGLVNRLESFDLFLENNPEYRGEVTYILVVVPSRDIITKYTENKMEIEGMVSRINGKHGNIGWVPVIYQYRSVEFKKLSALYLIADVALITPVRDGMNLVAKEFVASRRDKKGVLILSETAGASSELGEALIINPTDRKEVAGVLFQALNMSAQEQAERNEIMQKRLKNYDVLKWAEDFITSLQLNKVKQEALNVKEVNRQTENAIIQSYQDTSNRLIFLDYDGTLAPFARLPQLAVPGEELRMLLKQIGSEKSNTLVLISGRPAAILEKWFGDLPIHLVAEHGAFVKSKDNLWHQSIITNTDWKNSVLQVLDRFTEKCAGSFVEEKALSLAWHYRNAEKELGFIRSRELINSLDELSSHLDFQVIDGNKVVEARIRGIDKGLVATSWLNEDNYDFVLAIGDDKTDEDLFKAIPPEGYSIRVGLVPSIARFNIRNQKQVITFLQKISSAIVQETKQYTE